MGCALVLLLAIPVLVWVLWPRGEEASPSPDTRAAPARADDGERPGADPERLRDRLGRSSSEENALREELLRARYELDRLLLERARSPIPGMWEEAVAEQQREVAALEERVRALPGGR